MLKRRKTLSLVIGAFVVLVLLVVAGLFRSQLTNRVTASLSEPTAAPTETPVAVAEVRRGKVQKTLVLDGQLRAVRSRAIFANTSEEAKITYLPPEGSMVKAGDRLVELDSSTILDRMKDMEERIIAAENEIARVKAAQEGALHQMSVQLSQLWLEHEKAKLKARIPPDVVARREFQDNQLALEKAKAEYDNQITKIEQRKKEQQAELQVKVIEKEKLQVQLTQAKNNLDGMNIKAPADGMVIYSDHWDWSERRKLQIGDVVWGGFPIVTLPDLQEMEVLAQVNEVDGPKLSVGQKAKIVLDSVPHMEISGTVKEISQTAVKAGWMAKAKIFAVVISMDKTLPEMMKPGMSAQVSVIVAEHSSQLLVPRAAVRFDTDSPTVTRLEGENQRRPIAVTILASDPVHYAVADNGALKEGDRVISQSPVVGGPL
jgi:RND family efflux transporter MFP subunit